MNCQVYLVSNELRTIDVDISGSQKHVDIFLSLCFLNEEVGSTIQTTA